MEDLKLRPRVVILLVFLALGMLAMPTLVWARVNDNQSCMVCHGSREFSNKYLGSSLQNPKLYVNPELFKQSIHGTYPCTICHKGINDKSMPVNGVKFIEVRQQANSSCAGCHKKQADQLKLSAHGQDAKQKGKEVFCSDCHGYHEIQKKENASSLVSRELVTITCIRCHQGKEKQSYLESFHGRAGSLGSLQTPTCTSCHGSHDMLGPKISNSVVSPANVGQVCGKCHGAVGANFGKGIEHFEPKPGGPGAPVYWVRKVFSWLIILVLGFMLLHMELELLSYLWQNIPELFHKQKKR